MSKEHVLDQLRYSLREWQLRYQELIRRQVLLYHSGEVTGSPTALGNLRKMQQIDRIMDNVKRELFPLLTGSPR